MAGILDILKFVYQLSEDQKAKKLLDQPSPFFPGSPGKPGTEASWQKPSIQVKPLETGPGGNFNLNFAPERWEGGLQNLGKSLTDSVDTGRTPGGGYEARIGAPTEGSNPVGDTYKELQAQRVKVAHDAEEFSLRKKVADSQLKLHDMQLKQLQGPMPSSPVSAPAPVPPIPPVGESPQPAPLNQPEMAPTQRTFLPSEFPQSPSFEPVGPSRIRQASPLEKLYGAFMNSLGLGLGRNIPMVSSQFGIEPNAPNISPEYSEAKARNEVVLREGTPNVRIPAPVGQVATPSPAPINEPSLPSLKPRNEEANMDLDMSGMPRKPSGVGMEPLDRERNWGAMFQGGQPPAPGSAQDNLQKIGKVFIDSGVRPYTPAPETVNPVTLGGSVPPPTYNVSDYGPGENPVGEQIGSDPGTYIPGTPGVAARPALTNRQLAEISKYKELGLISPEMLAKFGIREPFQYKILKDGTVIKIDASGNVTKQNQPEPGEEQVSIQGISTPEGVALYPKKWSKNVFDQGGGISESQMKREESITGLGIPGLTREVAEAYNAATTPRIPVVQSGIGKKPEKIRLSTVYDKWAETLYPGKRYAQLDDKEKANVKANFKETEAAKKKPGSFKDEAIRQVWSTLTPDEKKKVVGAKVDPRELTERDILNVYGNIMTDPQVREGLQPIAEKLLQKHQGLGGGKVSLGEPKLSPEAQKAVSDAKEAIAKGADPKAVAERFKTKYKMDLPK